jgi:dihydroneopterin aldolase
MDIVYLRELKVETIIGVYDWERQARQTLVLDIDMGFDICRAAVSDDIEYALDYNKVAKRIVSFIEGCKYRLIETVAEQCASIILHEFDAKGCRVSVSKPGAIVNARNVGVRIERGEKLGG